MFVDFYQQTSQAMETFSFIVIAVHLEEYKYCLQAAVVSFHATQHLSLFLGLNPKDESNLLILGQHMPKAIHSVLNYNPESHYHSHQTRGIVLLYKPKINFLNVNVLNYVQVKFHHNEFNYNKKMWRKICLSRAGCPANAAISTTRELLLILDMK